MTIFTAFNSAIAQLTAHAPALQQPLYSQQEARTAARILLDELTGQPHAHLAQPQKVLDGAQRVRFENALDELTRGRPLAYVLGYREFFGLKFRCDERALIPRPETELLVEAAIRDVEKRQSSSVRSPTGKPLIADLGTGTGCIAIAVARHCPHAEVVATDASPQALALARENASALGVESVRLICGTSGDWAAPLREYLNSVDIIVSNPPYIAPRDIGALQVQIQEFEPRRALDGGEDGLVCYRQIAAQCGPLLRDDGALFCELGAGQFQRVQEIFKNAGWAVGDAIFDLQGIARVLCATKAPLA